MPLRTDVSAGRRGKKTDGVQSSSGSVGSGVGSSGSTGVMAGSPPLSGRCGTDGGMVPTCRGCGQPHETFLDGVICDVEQHGATRARERLLRFCSPAQASDLVEQAQRQLTHA